jgi:hypothetical protein
MKRSEQPFVCPWASMFFYRAALPLSCTTLAYLAGVARRHRKKIGSCWRKLNCGRQALLVLAHLRNGETFAALAAGFGIGTATAWRYVQETVALLAAGAPKLDAALRSARQRGHAFVVIDGTLIPIDRVAADRPFYSGKHRKHRMNLQVIASPHGEILWVSGQLTKAIRVLQAREIRSGRRPGSPARRRHHFRLRPDGSHHGGKPHRTRRPHGIRGRAALPEQGLNDFSFTCVSSEAPDRRAACRVTAGRLVSPPTPDR